MLDERLFWSNDDTLGNEGQTVNLKSDSYVWVFTGRRGGGKTTIMSLLACTGAWLWDMKIIANFPLEFKIRRVNGLVTPYTAEMLDMERLLMFDEEYKNVLILIDESPDIISHMASQTWKNRLLNVFVRQLRKNRNTLMLGAQDFELIDKSMRWQTDIIVECRDASKLPNNQSLARGECILTKFYDNSGQWTGRNTDDRIRQRQDPCVVEATMFPRVLWGQKGITKPVFDTYYQQDIFESLRRVDMKLSSYTVGDKARGDNKPAVSTQILLNALAVIEGIVKDGKNVEVKQREFYRALDGISANDKNKLAQLLEGYQISGVGDNSRRMLGFEDFDLDGFRSFVKNQGQGGN
jgi:hypothetical protein